MTNDRAIQIALEHHQAGRFAQAETLYRQVLRQNPNDPDALHLLGVLAGQAGQLDAAAELIQRAVTVQPRFAAAYCSLGNVLQSQGKPDEAVAAYRRALAIQPDSPDPCSNMGAALHDLGRLEEAVAAYENAIRLRPNYPEALSNLGNVLRDLGRPEDAIAACSRAIELRPGLAEAHNNLSNALRDHGDLDAAIESAGRAIELSPQLADAHWNLAWSLLLKGEFDRGWREYEWRWRTRRFPSVRRDFQQPQWHGEELNGRTILLHAEQGFGDTLQFIRYAPLVAQRGGRAIVFCQPELVRLVQSCPEIDRVIANDRSPPEFDLHCPLLSLPLVFGTDLNSIPAEVPYLHPPPQLVEEWRARIGRSSAGLRIGLAWAGRPTFSGDRTRSMTLSQLAPLAAVPNVTFYSLQKGSAAQQAERPPAGMRVIPLGPQLGDFADTAAAMASLDLILTTDTSIPHLAGALGRTAWVMLQFMPDWRWLLGREDSPWYPTLRLFRQTARGDWTGVVERVAAALADFRRPA